MKKKSPSNFLHFLHKKFSYDCGEVVISVCRLCFLSKWCMALPNIAIYSFTAVR